MKLGISLYPGLDADRAKSLLLLQKAAALGYSRVFSSLHIPESNAASLREDALYLFACAESLGLDVIADFYKDFSPLIEHSMNEKQEHKVGERVLGTDPKSGRQVSVKIGRFGPVVQIGVASDDEKPRFAQLHKGQSLDTLTLAEALELFALPRTLGEYEGSAVVVNTGRFGPYVQLGKMYVSLPAGIDPMTLTFEEGISLIEKKRQYEQQRQIKTFAENPDVEILNGPYGPYISMSGKNYKIPSGVEPASLDLAACMEIITKASEKPSTPRRRKK